MSQDQLRPIGSQRRARRILLWLITAATVVVVLLAGIAVSWLFFYKSDLPDVRALASVASAAEPVVADLPVCGQTRHAAILPAKDLADLRKVLVAAEGPVDPRPVLQRLYDDVSSRTTRLQYGLYSYEIARRLVCKDPRGTLQRTFAEIRTAIQLERRFSPDQLLNIHLNTAEFDENVYGVENGARHYFGKHAVELSPAEAALLIGIHQGPTYYSPLRHPDRAFEKRNQVLDTMAGQGVVSQEAAKVAKSTPVWTVLTSP